jgi:hypothetical protein
MNEKIEVDKERNGGKGIKGEERRGGELAK